jgi:gamma-glutamylcyclotransferase (GGCT)/AIG2-like uncharacterized protein YtfP
MDTTPEENSFIFVYGTLKRGKVNHRLMEICGTSVAHFPNLRAEFVGEAITKEKYPLVVDRLPYLLHRPGRGLHIKGILFCNHDRY